MEKLSPNFRYETLSFYEKCSNCDKFIARQKYFRINGNSVCDKKCLMEFRAKKGGKKHAENKADFEEEIKEEVIIENEICENNEGREGNNLGEGGNDNKGDNKGRLNIENVEDSNKENMAVNTLSTTSLNNNEKNVNESEQNEEKGKTKLNEYHCRVCNKEITKNDILYIKKENQYYCSRECRDD